MPTTIKAKLQIQILLITFPILSLLHCVLQAALKKWEEASGKKSAEAKEIKLIGVYPPIEKLEGPLHILVNCEKLSLSTNLIVQIQNLQVLVDIKFKV